MTTTNQRHKHADVIIAFAEGKTIQWFNPKGKEWITYTLEQGASGGPWIDDPFQWRIKPGKKKGWVNIYSDSFVSDLYQSKSEADCGAVRAANRIACIEIEYEEGQGIIQS